MNDTVPKQVAMARASRAPRTELPVAAVSRARATVVAGLLIALIAALALVGCSQGDAGVQSAPGAVPTVAVPSAAIDLQQTVVNVISTVQPSVVEVLSSGGQGQAVRAIGSGDIISADGYIVTNDHVVSGFSAFQVVLANGKTVNATLVGEAPADDLAVLKVSQSGLRPINFADSSKVQVGQFAVAVGSPLGLAQSATLGIVSAVNRTASEAPNGPAGTLTGLIQTSAPINPGNSGGALVDLQGKLIGIPTLEAAIPNSAGGGSAANGIGFAISSNRVKFVADQLVKNGHVTNTGQGFLGVAGQSVTPQLAQDYNLPADHGFIITGFTTDTAGTSPAQDAGLQQGDIIIAVNGTTINSEGDLASILQSLGPGAKVQVTVQRGSSQKTVTVTLGERPPNAGG